jgi:hypothetical protein
MVGRRSWKRSQAPRGDLITMGKDLKPTAPHLSRQQQAAVEPREAAGFEWLNKCK